jgi:hypothetical protein
LWLIASAAFFYPRLALAGKLHLLLPVINGADLTIVGRKNPATLPRFAAYWNWAGNNPG